MREIFGFAFGIGRWNFVIGAEIHLTSWVFGIRYSPAVRDSNIRERELTFHLPTLSFTLAWIDDESLEHKQEMADAIRHLLPAEPDED